MSENIIPQSLEDRLSYEINLLKQQIQQMKANQPPSSLGSKITMDQINGVITIFDNTGVAIMKLGYCGLDGSNNPLYGLLMNDGTSDRFFMGKQTGGF